MVDVYPPRCHLTLMSKPSLDLLDGYPRLIKFCGMRMSECMEIKCLVSQLKMNDI